MMDPVLMQQYMDSMAPSAAPDGGGANASSGGGVGALLQGPTGARSVPLTNPDGSNVVGPIQITPPAAPPAAPVPGQAFGYTPNTSGKPIEEPAGPSIWSKAADYFGLGPPGKATVNETGGGLTITNSKGEQTFGRDNQGNPTGPVRPALSVDTTKPSTAQISQWKRDEASEARHGVAPGSAGAGGGGPARSPWLSTIRSEDRAAFEQNLADRGQHMTDDEINQRLVNQKYQQAFDEQAAQRQAEQDQAAQELKRQQAAREKAAADNDAAQKAAASATLDPHKFWHDAGTGGSIMAVIGATLGAFGAGLTKTPNGAMEIINGAIDRDMKAQEENIATKKGTANNALARLTQETGSLDAAKIAFKQAGLATAQAQMNSLGASAQDSALMSTLQKQQDGLKQELLQFNLQTHQLPKPAGVGAPKAAAANGLIFKDPSTGKTYVAPNDEARKELVAQATANANLVAANNAWQAKMKDRGSAVTGIGDDAADVEALKGNLIDAMKVAKNPTGTRPLTPAQEEQMERITGTGTEFFTHPGKVDTFVNQHLADQARAYKTQDVKEVEEGFNADPTTGRLQTDSAYTGHGPPQPGAKIPGLELINK